MGNGSGYQLIGLVIAGAIAFWVYTDAKKRPMNAVLWAVGTFLLCIVFLPLYLIMRKPEGAAPGTPGVNPPQPMPLPPTYIPPPQQYAPPQQQYTPPQQQYTPPPPPQSYTPPPVTPQAGSPVLSQGPKKFCPNCGSPHEGTVKFCPNCGSAV